MVKKYIFDLDGTLYNFDGQRDKTFTESAFYAGLQQRTVQFLALTLGVGENQAASELTRIRNIYDGAVSKGVEREYGVDRLDYFAATWDADPALYIPKDEGLAAALGPFAGSVALLTAAPRVWADKVLSFLGVEEIFGDSVYTGEPDVRKPQPAAFVAVACGIGTDPSLITSIGDQNETDILPPKSLGMATVLIGPRQQDADFRASSIYEAISLLEEGD